MVLPFLPPQPGHHGWQKILGGLLPQPASCCCGRRQKGRERGSEGTRSRGRAGCVAIPPSLLGRPYAPDLIRAGSVTASRTALACATYSSPFSSSGKWEWPRLSKLGLGRWNERLRSDGTESTTRASRPMTRPFSNPATLRRAQARAGSKMRTKPARI